MKYTTREIVTKIIRRLRYYLPLRTYLWQLIHASRPPHWVLHPCGREAQILFRSNSHLGRLVYEGFELGEVRLIQRLVNKEMTVFDIGANFGYHTIFMANAVGDRGAVHSFEPSPKTYSQLQLNLALNSLSQVTPQCQALADRSGLVSFCIFPEGYDAYNSFGARERSEGQVSEQEIKVPATTLDAYCREHRVTRVDFLKIDVEGAEELVLRGGLEVLKQNPQIAILIELYEPSARQCGCSVAASMEIFQGLNLVAHRLDPRGAAVPLSREEYELTASGLNPVQNFVFIHKDNPMINGLSRVSS